MTSTAEPPSNREIEVLKLLAQGLTTKRIGDLLNISTTTVVTHCENLKHQFDSKNRIELIYKSVKQNIIS